VVQNALADHPDATIVNSATAGGFQLVAGFGGPGDWGNFDGNVDAVSLSTIAGTTSFNFEASVPEPSTVGVLAIAAVGLLARRRTRVSK